MDHATPRSGLFRAGEVLLLVGAILRVIMAFFLLVIAAGMTYVGSLAERQGEPLPVGFGVALYLAFAALFAVSAVIGLVAWRKARAGEVKTPGILGIVAAMLPPVDIVFLLGGIFLLVCDEAKADAP